MNEDDEENTRGKDDNTHFVFKPRDMKRPNVAPGGSMGTGALGGNTQPAQSSEQGQSFTERFEQNQPEPAPEQEPLIGTRTDDPEFNKELEDQGFTLFDPAPDQSQAEETPAREATSDLSQYYDNPVDIPENRRSFSERFNIEAPGPDKDQDGPDLSLPGPDHGPDIER